MAFWPERRACDELTFDHYAPDHTSAELSNMAQAAMPPADLLPVGPQANIPYRIVRLVAVPLLHLFFRFDVEGLSNVPRPGNYVVIANHLNWLDEFALLMLLPIEPRLHFLANPTLLVTRRVQWFLVRSTGGFVPVVQGRHGDPALFHHVDRCLEVGGAVAIFPEGNYGPAEGELMPFKKGFAHFAIKAKVPVLPVALSGTKDLWFGKRIKVVVGEPLPTADHDPDSLTAAAFEKVKALMPAYRDQPGRKWLRKKLTNLF
ncbi:MAG TPA: 1-acyl-sn-glycerol-3-phosphate acyltransferase [Candidatus Acidoferrum sp.]|nr:1-acyl-sn-glycerol-3-phosphate acyltransferase [Candidatus Acidoferrum sp.]